MKKPARGGLSEGQESQAGATILTLPTRDYQRRIHWRTCVEAWRSPADWHLLHIHRNRVRPYLGRVVAL